MNNFLSSSKFVHYRVSHKRADVRFEICAQYSKNRNFALKVNWNPLQYLYYIYISIIYYYYYIIIIIIIIILVLVFIFSGIIEWINKTNTQIWRTVLIAWIFTRRWPLCPYILPLCIRTAGIEYMRDLLKAMLRIRGWNILWLLCMTMYGVIV